MIEYTAIKHNSNQLVITIDNKYKDLLHNIDFNFKIIKEVWWFYDDSQPLSTTVEPPNIPYFNPSDYEVTLEFKSEEDREFFDYILDRHCSNIDKLEYALEVAV